MNVEAMQAADWLFAAMSEWNTEYVPCDWAVTSDEHNEIIEIEYTPDVDGAETSTERYTFTEAIAAVKAAAEIYKKHPDECRLMMFQIAVEILRNSKSN